MPSRDAEDAALAGDVGDLLRRAADSFAAVAETLRRRAADAGADQAMADMCTFLLALPQGESVALALLALHREVFPAQDEAARD